VEDRMKDSKKSIEIASSDNPDIIVIPADEEKVRQENQMQQEIENRRNAARNELIDLSKQVIEKENKLKEVEHWINELSDRRKKLISEIEKSNERIKGLEQILPTL
jgi:peptidoglycan hydrolase CwlO-like protein